MKKKVRVSIEGVDLTTIPNLPEELKLAIEKLDKDLEAVDEELSLEAIDYVLSIVETYKGYDITYDSVTEYYGVKDTKYTYINKDLSTMKPLIDQLIKESYGF